MQRLRLADARHVLHGGRPCLSVAVEGRPCLIGPASEQAALHRGLVSVGEAFRDLLPDVGLMAEGRRLVLRGYTADHRLYRLFRDFLDDFREGPVAIPD